MKLLLMVLILTLFHVSALFAKNNTNSSRSVKSYFFPERMHSQNIEALGSQFSTSHYDYFLDIHFENERRVFSLYKKSPRQWQELYLEKSYDVSSDAVAFTWMQQLIRQYQLVPTTESDVERLSTFSTVPTTKESEGLWTAIEEWSPRWEQEYGRWVAKNLTPHFMVDYNLKTDCADAAYTLRWIFAYINKLPMASRLGGSRQLFTNESMQEEWLKLPTDPDWKKNQRFKKALEYVLKNTYTHTLMDDSYPVGVSADELTPGTHHLALRESSGHTMIVYKVNDPDGLPLTMLYSNLPVIVRDLIQTFFQEGQSPTLNDSGFYKIRWAQKNEKGWRLIPAKAIPGYSEDQFNLKPEPNQPYFWALYRKINPDFSLVKMVQMAMKEIIERLQDRIKLVEDGYQYCLHADCSPGSAGDEDWSTPSRDRRLLMLERTLRDGMTYLSDYDSKAYLEQILLIQKQVKETTFFIEGKNHSLEQLAVAMLYRFIQSDARLPIAERWGVNTVGLGSYLVKNMQFFLKERKLRIAEAQQCQRTASCFNPKDFITKYNTTEMDTKVLTLWHGAQLICNSMDSKTDCSQLREYLLKPSYDNKSFLQWFESASLWLSNPFIAPENRWGSQEEHPFFALTTNDEAKLYLTPDKLWFVFDDNLYSKTDYKQIEFANNERFGSFHNSGSYFYTYENTKSETQDGTDTTNEVTLRFYQPPHRLISKVSLKLPEEPWSERKIWWTGPNKDTLSLFVKNKYYEINLQGEIVKQAPFLRFAHGLYLKQIIFVITETGVYISDGAKDASHWVKLPLDVSFLPKIDFQVTRIIRQTDRGWAMDFPNISKFYLIEETGNYFEWAQTNIDEIFVNKAGDLIIKQDRSSRLIEVYTRGQEQSHATKSDPQRIPFTLTRTFTGNSFEAFDSVLVISTLEQKKLLTLPDLQPLPVKCETLSETEVLSDSYYTCYDHEVKRLYHRDGTLLYEGPLNSKYFDYIIEKDKQFWFLNTIRDKSDQSERAGEFNFQEYFPLSSESPVRPHFQIWKYFAEPPVNSTQSFKRLSPQGFVGNLPVIFSYLLSNKDFTVKRSKLIVFD